MHARHSPACLLRWHNQLDPTIKRCAWTMEEEETLMAAHQEFGNSWAEIAKRLPVSTVCKTRTSHPACERSELAALALRHCLPAENASAYSLRPTMPRN